MFSDNVTLKGESGAFVLCKDSLHSCVATLHSCASYGCTVVERLLNSAIVTAVATATLRLSAVEESIG